MGDDLPDDFIIDRVLEGGHFVAGAFAQRLQYLSIRGPIEPACRIGQVRRLRRDIGKRLAVGVVAFLAVMQIDRLTFGDRCP